MIINYIKIAFRGLLRHKGYSLLNIVGLSIGLAASTLILLSVQFEWSYDRFHTNADRIYRVIKRDPGNVFLGTDYFSVVPEPLGRSMIAEYPEVEKYVTLSEWDDMTIKVREGAEFQESVLYATAPALFEIFSYKFKQGDPATALAQVNSVVLSQSVARRFFGNEDPVGKTLLARDQYHWTVTGVFEDMPRNSQLTHGMVTSFDTYKSTLKPNPKFDNFAWGNSSWYTYLLLRHRTDPLALQAKIPALVQKYVSGSNKSAGGEPTQFFLQALTDIHLYNKANFDFGKSGDIKSIYILLTLALVIVTTACINYTNLATARASLRAREVGVRKVVGAGRRQLIIQFIGESVLVAFIAAAIALVLCEIFLPSFSELVGTRLDNSMLIQPSVMIGYGILVLIVGFASGVYPALVLSGFQAARVIKGDLSSGSRSPLRNTLVVIQFTASITLIICTLIVLSQLRFIRTQDLGYQRDNIVVLRLTDKSVGRQIEAVKERLRQSPFVLGATACSHLPVNVTSETSLHWPGMPEGSELQAYQLYGDFDFLKTFEIQTAEGRDFSRSIASDTGGAYIINETLQRELGWRPAVGRELSRWHGDAGRIVGVMKDFHLHSFRQQIHPLFLRLNGWSQYLCIRIDPGHVQAAISDIESVWRQFATERPFEYSFLDDEFNKLYKQDERLGEIVSYCTGLAITIACLGLFGLASFIIERRRKEIGVRKVLGASVYNVVRMLSAQFMRLVVIANVVAWPVAFYVMRSWLDGFAYRVDIGYVVFLISALLAFVAAVLTVALQAIRAALTNPVEALRYE